MIMNKWKTNKKIAQYNNNQINIDIKTNIKSLKLKKNEFQNLI